MNFYKLIPTGVLCFAVIECASESFQESDHFSINTRKAGCEGVLAIVTAGLVERRFSVENNTLVDGRRTGQGDEKASSETDKSRNIVQLRFFDAKDDVWVTIDNRVEVAVLHVKCFSKVSVADRASALSKEVRLALENASLLKTCVGA